MKRASRARDYQTDYLVDEFWQKYLSNCVCVCVSNISKENISLFPLIFQNLSDFMLQAKSSVKIKLVSN